MPTFRYKAYDSSGKASAGDIDAAGLKDAAQKLRSTGLYPANISEAGVKEGVLRSRGVPPQLLALTTRQLSTLLSSGSTLSESLDVLVENSSTPRLKSILLAVKESVIEGNSLSRALEAHPEVFSTFYRGLVASGEASGSLDKVLTRLADYLEARSRILNEVKAALTYPALMTIVGAVVLSFLFIFVIPKISRMFEETHSALPLITVLILSISNLLRSFWPVFAALLAVSVWLFGRYRKSGPVKAFTDRLILRLPWFGELATCFYVSTMARTLGSLLKDGVQMLRALEITREVLDNIVFDGILETAGKDCSEGSALSASLKKNEAVPPIAVHMISVGEKSGKLDEMLLKTAESYDLEFQAGVKRTLNLLEPLLILAMGLIVGFIVLAILLPIFELNQIIR
ncbi:MAG: type II secretion system inner membrane protein GspF [Deltaproteobacteria bacterium]|nr:type II secretion system inner membrane protein GspF [Deltaproteobacteria bacterium]